MINISLVLINRLLEHVTVICRSVHSDQSRLRFLLKQSPSRFNTISSLYGSRPRSALQSPSLIIHPTIPRLSELVRKAHHAAIRLPNTTTFYTGQQSQNKAKSTRVQQVQFSPWSTHTHRDQSPGVCLSLLMHQNEETRWKEAEEEEVMSRAGSEGISPPGLSNYL